MVVVQAPLLDLLGASVGAADAPLDVGSEEAVLPGDGQGVPLGPALPRAEGGVGQHVRDEGAVHLLGEGGDGGAVPGELAPAQHLDALQVLLPDGGRDGPPVLGEEGQAEEDGGVGDRSGGTLGRNVGEADAELR